MYGFYAYGGSSSSSSRRHKNDSNNNNEGSSRDASPPSSSSPSYFTRFLQAGTLVGMAGVVSACSVYKKVPPNKLLVVYGRGAGGIFSGGSFSGMRIVKNGGATVFPIVQGAHYMSLEPMAMEIPLRGALSKEKIRVNVPSVFTVAVSAKEETARNAAQRLLHMSREDIQVQAEEVIVGQMRQVLAGLTIDEINRNREKFVGEVQVHCETELEKLGLTLLSTNVQNITDESGVIDALGKKAAATAKQQALIDVATEEKNGAIGVSAQLKLKDISVSANERERSVGVRKANREATTRLEQLEAEELVDVNLARQKKSESDAMLAAAKAGFEQQAEIARKEAVAAIAEADARAQTRAALAYAEQVEAETRARLEAVAKAEKAKAMVDAEAKAEELRIIAEGEAAAAFAVAAARARGEAHGLKQKAEGLGAIVNACGGSDHAYRLLMLEKLDTLAETSAKAISNIKFDKVVVWDGGKGPGTKHGAIPGFINDVTSSLPPTLDVLKDIVGVDLRSSLAEQEQGNKQLSDGHGEARLGDHVVSEQQLKTTTEGKPTKKGDSGPSVV